MPVTGTGTHNSHHITMIAIDGAGVEKILFDVQGDPSLGDRMPLQREGTDVRVRGMQITRLPGDEQPISKSWQSLNSEEARDFRDFCLHEGTIYGPTGSSPAVSVDTISTYPCVKLRVRIAPPSGAAVVKDYGRAYYQVTNEGGNPATLTHAFECYDRSVV